MSWKNLKIGKKLSIGFGTIIVLLIVLSIFNYQSFVTTKDNVSKVEETNNNTIFMVEKEVDHLNWLNGLTNLFLDDNVKEVTVQLDDHKCGLGKWLYSEETQQLASNNPELAALLNKIKEPHNQLHSSASHINQVYTSNTDAAHDDALQIMQNETKDHLVETQKILKEIKAYFQNHANTINAETGKNINNSISMMIIISFLVILVGSGAAFFITRGISKPVSEMAYIADEIAVGNINQNVAFESKDEIGVLASSFRKLIQYMKEMANAAEQIAENDLTVEVHPRSEYDVLGNSVKTMIKNLTGIIRQINDNATQLVSAATEISSSSEQMSKGAEEQAQQVAQISTAIEEMSATIVQTAKNSGEASDGAKRSNDTASEGGQIVSDTINSIQRISEVSRGSAQSIAKLAKSADHIGEIINVIDDIADQTNLLALNAAIEAARAGEQGRGFAVVADEVRKLAERTGKATGEITEMIKSIQGETKDAVTSMESGIVEVDNGRDLADKAGSSLNEIVHMSQQLMDMIQQIATASEEQSTAAEQISKNVEHVASVTKETASGAQQSAAAAEQLNRQAEGLKQMVANFRIK